MELTAIDVLMLYIYTYIKANSFVIIIIINIQLTKDLRLMLYYLNTHNNIFETLLIFINNHKAQELSDASTTKTMMPSKIRV